MKEMFCYGVFRLIGNIIFALSFLLDIKIKCLTILLLLDGLDEHSIGGVYLDGTFLGSCRPAIFNFVVVQFFGKKLDIVQFFSEKVADFSSKFPIRRNTRN